MEDHRYLSEKAFGWSEIFLATLGISYMLFCAWTLIRYLSLGGPLDHGVGITLMMMLMASPSILLLLAGIAVIQGKRWGRIVNGVVIPLGIFAWTGFHATVYLEGGILYLAQRIAIAMLIALIPALSFHWEKHIIRKVALFFLILSVLFLAGNFAFGV